MTHENRTNESVLDDHSPAGLVQWLRAKYARHHEIEDKLAAYLIERLAHPTPEAAQGVVVPRDRLWRWTPVCMEKLRPGDDEEVSWVTYQAYERALKLAAPLAVREEAQAVEALRELATRAENFWAFLQGEYGVKLSAEDQEDHNVAGFFAALETANTALSASPSTPGRDAEDARRWALNIPLHVANGDCR